MCNLLAVQAAQMQQRTEDWDNAIQHCSMVVDESCQAVVVPSNLTSNSSVVTQDNEEARINYDTDTSNADVTFDSKSLTTGQPELSLYEQQRLKNIEDNEKTLLSLGLLDMKCSNRPTVKRHRHKKVVSKPESKKYSLRTSSVADYNEDQCETEQSLKQHREPKLSNKTKTMKTNAASYPSIVKKVSNKHSDVCKLLFDDIPDAFKERFPLNEGRNASGFMYVHEVQRGYQVQMYVPFANGTKRLVHHGIFQDLRTAALAQSIASSDLNIACTSNGGRHFIESLMLDIDTVIASTVEGN